MGKSRQLGIGTGAKPLISSRQFRVCQISPVVGVHADSGFDRRAMKIHQAYYVLWMYSSWGSNNEWMSTIGSDKFGSMGSTSHDMSNVSGKVWASS